MSHSKVTEHYREESRVSTVNSIEIIIKTFLE